MSILWNQISCLGEFTLPGAGATAAECARGGCAAASAQGHCHVGGGGVLMQQFHDDWLGADGVGCGGLTAAGDERKFIDQQARVKLDGLIVEHVCTW
jgi:hypothetical protein